MAKAEAQDKRQAIQEQVKGFDAELKKEFGPQHFGAGYCLLLGRYYAQSSCVYFSLNPGFPRSGALLNPESSGSYNVPFRNPEALRKEYVYLHNCERFFASYPLLNTWINNKITSAFLVPWRTADTADLRRLNQLTKGRLFFYAGELVKQIIRDHQAQVLVTAGKSALTLLEDLAVIEEKSEQAGPWGPGKSYQWSKCILRIEGRALSVLQIPHFSRANSPVKMGELAGWLAEELKLPATGRILANDGKL